jgi:SAM-dependent methyltransferase
VRRAIRNCVTAFVEACAPEGPVVEIGSYYVPGMDALCDLRPLFRGREFIGCDIRRGHGVDRIEDASQLSFGSGTVGTVLMFEILEHLPDPARAVDESFRVLRPDGLLAVSVPFTYRLHGFPTDYWRFTASGVDRLLARFPSRVVVSVGPRLKPAFIFAVACRGTADVFGARRERFLASAEARLRRTRVRGYYSLLKERTRDLLGLLLGRAEVQMTVFDPAAPGGYLPANSSRPANPMGTSAPPKASRPEASP